MPEALAGCLGLKRRRLFDFIFVCIASLQIARFRAGVASSKVRHVQLRVRVLDTLRLYAILPWPLFGHPYHLFEKESNSAETSEPLRLECHAALGDWLRSSRATGTSSVWVAKKSLSIGIPLRQHAMVKSAKAIKAQSTSPPL